MRPSYRARRRDAHALQDALNVRININNKDDGGVVVIEVRCEEAKTNIEENILLIAIFFIKGDYRHFIIEPHLQNR